MQGWAFRAKIGRLRAGDIIAGRYEVITPVRVGALSTVLKVKDRDTGTPLALKVINVYAADPTLQRRIDRELEILRGLSHPHVVRCLGAGRLDATRKYLVLEWLEGQDLADYKAVAALTLRHVLLLLVQLSDALALAHERGVVHRDIKPANVFLVRPEPQKPPDSRLIDFGVAKGPDFGSALTQTGAILGTPTYMAPEQASFATDVDGRADIFSLGVLGYELLLGRLPWSSATDLARLARITVETAIPVRSLAPEAPEAVARLLESMLESAPDRRPQSAQEVRDAAQRCLSTLAPTYLDSVHTADGAILEQFRGSDTLDLPEPGAESAEKSSATDVRFLFSARPREPLSSDEVIGGPTDWLEEQLPAAPVAALEVGFGDVSYVDHRDDPLLFGRVAEIERLRARVGVGLGDGPPSCTLVVGPAGIGKTALRSELVRVLHGQKWPVRIHSARAEEALRNTPYALLRRVLANEARLLPDDPPALRLSKLDALVPPLEALEPLLGEPEGELTASFGPSSALTQAASAASTLGGRELEVARAMLGAFLAEVMQVPAPELPVVTAARASPRLFGEQIRRALEIILRGLAARTGLVLLIDDAHCLDFGSAAVLVALLRSPQPCRIAAVFFGLPHLLDTETRHPSPLADLADHLAPRLELSPLDPRAARELVRSVARVALESESLEALVQRAQGHPLYLEQLVRSVQATGLLSVGEGGELVLASDSELIPPTVAAAVSARLSALPPSVQKVITAASVFGEVFWVEGVAKIVDAPLANVAVDLDRALAANLVRRRSASRYGADAELEFVHAVLRSVALARLKRKRRQAFEQRALGYLYAAGEHDPAVLAAHQAQGESPREAAALYAQAAQRALALGEIESAGALVEEGLRLEADPAQRVELLLLQENIALAAGDLSAGQEALDALSLLARSATENAAIWERRSRLAFAVRRFGEARSAAETARQAWEAEGHAEGCARADLLAAEAAEAMGDGRAALRGYLAAQAALGSKTSEGLVRTTRGLARIALSSGDYRTAESRMKSSLLHARSLRDMDGVFWALIGLAETTRLSGDPERAREFLDDARDGTFDRERRVLVRVYRAGLFAEEQRFDEAYARLERIYVATDDPDLGTVRRWATLLMGQMLRRKASSDDALRADPERLAVAKDRLFYALEDAAEREPGLVMALKLALAVIVALQGDAPFARALDIEAQATFQREGAVYGDEPPWIFYAHARVLQLTGATENEVKAALLGAVRQLDAIAGRLERRARQRYLERWVARAVLDDATRAGLSLSRDVSSNRLVVRLGT